MSLPQQIPVKYTEEDAGFVSVRPVEKQTFQLHQLADLVVGAIGKDPARVGKILASGTINYNGYRYWWDSISVELTEVEALLASFPDDDPSREFKSSQAVTAIFEIGGGTQRTVVEVQKIDAARKKFFGKTAPWETLLQNVARFPARYEKYSHARKADLFRVSLPYGAAQELVRAMKTAAPGSTRRKWGTLRPARRHHLRLPTQLITSRL